MDIPKHPLGGSVTQRYLTNDDDGTVKVPVIYINESIFQDTKKDKEEYKWRDEDFLLVTYPKNGTNVTWEIMTMLLRGSAEYISDIKIGHEIEFFPLSKMNAAYPSPRVLNTHYRLDVLPKEFRGRKSVLVIRNPKDVAVSYFHHEKRVMGSIPEWRETCERLTFSTYLKIFLYDKDMPAGSYFDYIEYMWSLKDEPYLHIVYFEDLITDPISTIQTINEFMGTQRSPELVQKIADAISFTKMKEGKLVNFNLNSDFKEHVTEIIDKDLIKAYSNIYRTGKIGDWKNHFTVAEDEMFDEFLDKWTLSKEIPFRYS